MKKILFILFLIIPFIGFGQGWEKVYPITSISGYQYDEGFSVQQTTDNGFIITGYTSNDEQDILLIKTDSLGDTLWTSSLIEPCDQYGHSIQQTNDGGYIIGGTKEINGPNSCHGDMWLIKFDSNGNPLWEKMFGSNSYEEGRSVQQTNDGGYVITGSVSTLSNQKDVYVVKTDMNGNIQWDKSYGNGLNDIGYSIKQTSDGGYIITGTTELDSVINIYLIKTDNLGDTLWTRSFGNSFSYEIGYSVQQTTDGGYIICGSTSSLMNYIYVIKTDSSGNIVWTHTYGDGEEDVGYSIQQTSDGGYIMTGKIEDNGINGVLGESDLYLIKIDSLGDTTWTEKFDSGNWNSDIGYSVQETNNGGYVISGSTDSWSGLYVYLIKTDFQGNITSTFNIPTPSSNRKLEKVVDVLGRETKPQTNTPFIEIYDDGSTEKKIVVE